MTKPYVLATISFSLLMLPMLAQFNAEYLKRFEHLPDETGDALFIRRIVLPNLTTEAAQRLAREFASHEAKSVPLAILTMAPTPINLRLYGGTPFEERGDFPSRAALVPFGMMDFSNSARVISINGNCLFSFRRHSIAVRRQDVERGLDHSLTETIIEGPSDPTQIKIESRRYRILNFGHEGQGKDRSVIVNIKAQGREQPSCDDCKHIAAMFKDLSRAPYVYVEIRQDSWAENASFPIVFPFEPDSMDGAYWREGLVMKIPSAREFYLAYQMNCNLYAERFSCDATGKYRGK